MDLVDPDVLPVGTGEGIDFTQILPASIKVKTEFSDLAKKPEKSLIVDIRQEVNKRLEAGGKSIDWLSHAASVPRATVFRFLSGRGDCRSFTAARLLAAFVEAA